MMNSLIRVTPNATAPLPIARGMRLDSTRNPVIVLDSDEQVIELNEAASALLGAALGSTPCPSLDRLCPELALQINGTDAKDTQEIRLGEGQAQRFFEVQSSRVYDHAGNRAGRVLVLHEVTERIRDEENLRTSEAFFRVITENSTDIILIVSGDGMIEYVSSALERTMGRGSDEVVGTNTLELVHPDDVDQLFAALAESLQAPSISPAFTARIRDEASRWRILECVANNLLDNPSIKGILINARDVTERTVAEEALKASLLEKEILLKEIHHRVKNNLQIICSLLNLQSNTIDDPQALVQFQDSQNRIRSMALIHERLYQSKNLGLIDFGPYLSDLATSLVQTYRRQAQNTRLDVEADSMMLDIDTAIPCGLIINELVSNALKHAFPDARPGLIHVEMRHSAEQRQYHLIIADDGVGIEQEQLSQFTASLGLQLVQSLTRQLGGKVEVSGAAGTRFDIRFPGKAINGV
jgi:PAS domain S-box-containing protein